MPTRVTGMYSGMDTESIISQLVDAKRVKVTAETKKQSTIKYKQDAWEDLNKKLKNLFSSTSNLRFYGAYAKKTTAVSDSSVASVITADNAMVTNQTLKVTSLAKAGYMTGGVIHANDGNGNMTEKATSATMLSDIGINIGDKLNVNVGGKDTEIEITEDISISSLKAKIEEAGVNCNFDSTQQRFYIGSKDMGEEYDFTISGSMADKLGLTSAKGAVKEDAANASIILNGATYTSNSNTFEINGLTITAKDVTGDKSVTLSTEKDTSATYDMIKKFITEYSKIMNEMDKLYNASTKTKYDPLTDEEKSAMSDYEIEKWEEGLKEQILAKDSNISSISSALKSVMSAGYEVNGKMMYLFDFGIENASYFTAADNEKNAYHIYGDEEDSVFSSESNKLKAMIASDPDTVADFFTALTGELYSKMDKISARVANTRTFGYFYDDQKMKSDYDSYKDKLADMEDKLAAYEDKWYKKFSAMETAMAKMQSNANAITGLFGSN